jgi:hypothetical protein
LPTNDGDTQHSAVPMRFTVISFLVGVFFIGCNSGKDPKFEYDQGQIWVIGQGESEYASAEGIVLDFNLKPLSGEIRFTTTSGDEIMNVFEGRFSGKIGEQKISKVKFRGDGFNFEKKFRANAAKNPKIIIVLDKPG